MSVEEKEKFKTMSAQELARERTSMAVERNALANQRTFSAWIRTGLSSILAGLAIVRFIGDEEIFKGYVILIGILFVVIGIGIYILAYITYRNAIEEQLKESKSVRTTFIILSVITMTMIMAAIMIGLLLVFF